MEALFYIRSKKSSSGVTMGGNLEDSISGKGLRSIKDLRQGSLW